MLGLLTMVLVAICAGEFLCGFEIRGQEIRSFFADWTFVLNRPRTPPVESPALHEKQYFPFADGHRLRGGRRLLAGAKAGKAGGGSNPFFTQTGCNGGAHPCRLWTAHQTLRQKKSTPAGKLSYAEIEAQILEIKKLGSDNSWRPGPASKPGSKCWRMWKQPTSTDCSIVAKNLAQADAVELPESIVGALGGDGCPGGGDGLCGWIDGPAGP